MKLCLGDKTALNDGSFFIKILAGHTMSTIIITIVIGTCSYEHTTVCSFARVRPRGTATICNQRTKVT